MGLVLCRKKGEVISLDNEVYIEISDLNSVNKAVEVYIYNKQTDKETRHNLSLNSFFNFKWSKFKEVNLSIKLSNGKSQYKIYLEADKNISIGRENRIFYNNYVDNFDNNLIDDDEYEPYEDNDIDYSITVSSGDELAQKYKDELSWFYQ